ncbi:MAG: VOC family protein [Leptotrichiaceae bacterium]|nr:VOC family protein [Leptotrichiaceae bacterium]
MYRWDINCLLEKTKKITCICLGVRNMEKSVKFYRDGLGFETDCKEDNPNVIFFNTYGTKFELYPLDLLAEDISKEEPPKIKDGFSGVTLAYNVETKEEVNEVIKLVKKAGGKIVKEPQEVFWGGYHAYFQDLDGYYWEVAWGPDFKYDEKGLLIF